MKIAEINGAQIHVFPAQKTMLIIEKDAIFIRCLECGEIKSVHMLTNDSKSLPWMRMCFCGTNAPHTGGDTQPLTDPEPEQTQPVSPFLAGLFPPLPMPEGFTARLVERDQ